MNITLKGRVDKVKDAVDVTDTFTKRELWMTIDEETDFPQKVSVEFVKDKCSLIDKYSEGDVVEVDINLRGNEANTKKGLMRFNTLNGWRIKGNASGADMPGAPEANTSASPPLDAGTPAGGDDDDLPF